MPSIDTASAELEQAFALLQTVVHAGPPPRTPSQSADALGELSIATIRLLQSGSALTASMERLQVALESLSGSLQAEDIVGALEQRVETFAGEMDAGAREKRDAFESMVEDLSTAAREEIQQWLTEGAEAIAKNLTEAGEQVGKAAEEALQRLAKALTSEVEKVSDRVTESVKDRSAGALNDVVEAAVGRAVNQVTDTLITTQAGTTITSAIGPYLPIIIALRRSLGAIQSALDAMRAGT